MDIFSDLVKTGNWSIEQVQLGVEFDFKCAYCAKDMMSCVDNHSEWQIDHVIPSSADGKDSMDNLALSCRTCNFMKGAWNPSDALNNPQASKEDLINAAKKYISEIREKKKEALEKYQKIINRYRSQAI